MFDVEIQSVASVYSVPESWIRAVIETESSFDPKAYRAEPRIGDASYGLMQLLYKTAQGLGYTGPREGLFDPLTNIDLGTRLLSQLRAKYGDDFKAVYSAYNSGSPTLWQTSAQVGRNVERAFQNLTKWLQTGVAEFTANPESTPIVALLVAVLLWAWSKKGR